MRVLWAYNDQLPAFSNDIMKHQLENRGTRSVHFTDPPAPSEEETNKLENDPSVSKMEFFADNVTLPADYDTLYWCQIFQLPTLVDKMQLIRVCLMEQLL